MVKNTIHMERESVCMGDDCTAPNAAELTFEADEMLSEFMDKVAKYVPEMKDVVWSVVQLDKKTIAYLISDGSAKYTCELAVDDIKVAKLKEPFMFCRYYYAGKLMDYRTVPNVDLYPEYPRLIDKVKAHENNKIHYSYL